MYVKGIAFPDIDPYLIRFGDMGIAWYGVAYVVGFLLSWRYMRYYVNRFGFPISWASLDSLGTYIIFGVILGGRFGYVTFYNASYYMHHPWEIIQTWKGGMSFHGGLVGVIVAIALFTRRYPAYRLSVADLLARSAPIGLFFGRIANFINGELYGRITSLPFGVRFPAGGYLPRHPSQIYEAILEGLILFILTNVYGKRGKGAASGSFLWGYGMARIFVEFFRVPDPQIGFLFSYFTLGQFLSVPLIVLGVYVERYAKKLPS